MFFVGNEMNVASDYCVLYSRTVEAAEYSRLAMTCMSNLLLLCYVHCVIALKDTLFYLLEPVFSSCYCIRYACVSVILS